VIDSPDTANHAAQVLKLLRSNARP